MEPDVRDQVIDFVAHWRERTGFAQSYFIKRLGIHKSRYIDWRGRYGRSNIHNGKIPRDFWLLEEEQERILNYWRLYPLEGYRRLSYMMIDEDVVYASPSSVYRVLQSEGLLQRWNTQKSKKGSGFKQPLSPHSHWHTDISYLNICGTFYFLCSVLDGYSRMVLHWEIGEQMKEEDVQLVIQRCLEKYPGVHPRIISDNGPQFVAKEFKIFVREAGMTHVRTAPYYPQSNGKIERFHKTLKTECIRPKTPLNLDQAQTAVENFVYHYNNVRLHSSIGYVTPADMLAGKQEQIQNQRDKKLEAARQVRRQRRVSLAA